MRVVVISTWEEFVEVEALMMPGDSELDPLEVNQRSGPVDPELPESLRQSAQRRAAGARRRCESCNVFVGKNVVRCGRCEVAV